MVVWRPMMLPSLRYLFLLIPALKGAHCISIQEIIEVSNADYQFNWTVFCDK